MEAPERIWADGFPYAFPGFDPCYTWHSPDSIEDGVDGLTEYVRADIHATLAARLAEVERERDEAKRWAEFWGERGQKLHDTKARAERLEAALRLADDALTEAEAILGGEYGDHYGPLCDTMLKLRGHIAALQQEDK